MIGFAQDLQDISKVRDEGPETQKLQKNELYDLVANDFLLPPCTSKGVTREYLLNVRNGKVFRVTNHEWKTFEYKLEKKHHRKSQLVNNPILVRKLNILLKSYGQHDLGFDEYNVPEQNWLFKMARYIDRTNLLEFFEEPVEREPAPTDTSSNISKIHSGRQYACEFLFDEQRKKANKKLWHSLRVLAETYRMLMGSKIHVEVLQHELVETITRVKEQETALQDLLGKAAFAYAAIDNHNITADAVITNMNSLSPEIRTRLSMVSQL
jgi:hypothetical protein